MQYPGHLLKKGSTDKEAIKALQLQLTAVGCGDLTGTGVYGDKTVAAVTLFQMRFPDRFGMPLKPDGKVGPLTWEALFGAKTVTVTNRTTDFLSSVLDVARSQIGVMEQPPGSNAGPQVEAYLKSVGLGKGYSWCAAFIYWCFNQARSQLGKPNPVVKTAGVLDHWSRAVNKGIPVVTSSKAKNDPSIVKPGFIFIMDYGSGAGHTGLVEKIQDGRLVTIEGNTNDGGSREGIGVFRRTGRKIFDVNKGFIDYSSF